MVSSVGEATAAFRTAPVVTAEAIVGQNNHRGSAGSVGSLANIGSRVGG